MKEGTAFLDRLLAMSREDLEAYNKAYTEKMEAAQKSWRNQLIGQTSVRWRAISQKLNNALRDYLQLEAIGNDTMKGFVTGQL